MDSAEQINWEIEDLGRSIDMVVKQLEPAKQLIVKIEDSITEANRCLKEAQRILGKAKRFS